jgi:hypothetical protein
MGVKLVASCAWEGHGEVETANVSVLFVVGSYAQALIGGIAETATTPNRSSS